MSNATPHFTPGNLHNNNPTNEPGEANGNYNHHWQQQLQRANESRQGAQHPHRHCKKAEAVRLLHKLSNEAEDEEKPEEGKEERNRASVSDVVRRQDWDALDLSGQGLKCISLPIFTQFLFLRKLFLDHNSLHRIDPAIGKLRLLSHLDISENQLTEIPPEIGMLVNLKCLLLFDNQLTALPTEIGHLFKLDFLGIDGNPWGQDYKAHFMDHGTKGLITCFRDVYLGEFCKALIFVTAFH